MRPSLCLPRQRSNGLKLGMTKYMTAANFVLGYGVRKLNSSQNKIYFYLAGKYSKRHALARGKFELNIIYLPSKVLMKSKLKPLVRS